MRELLTEFCVAELEEVSGEGTGIHHFNAAGFGVGLGFPQPIVQESSHPYTDDVTLTGLRLIFSLIGHLHTSICIYHFRSCGIAWSGIIACRV